ncbi:hypothetical protein EDB89DRAFT_1913257 [Lactarius sanguifluus]|nr:hypothetical protein EDB89DRAFT_1913257 [Lactarius sanguifluus]
MRPASPPCPRTQEGGRHAHPSPLVRVTPAQPLRAPHTQEEGWCTHLTALCVGRPVYTRGGGAPTPVPLGTGDTSPAQPHMPHVRKRRDGAPTPLPSARATLTQPHMSRPTLPAHARGGTVCLPHSSWRGPCQLSPTRPTLPAHARGGAVRPPQHPPRGQCWPNPTCPAPLARAVPTSPTPSPGTQGDRQCDHPSAWATPTQPHAARACKGMDGMPTPLSGSDGSPAQARKGTDDATTYPHGPCQPSPTPPRHARGWMPHATWARKGMDGATTRPRGPRQPSSMPPRHAKGWMVQPPVHMGHASPAPRRLGTQGDRRHDHPSPLRVGDSSPAPRTPHRPARVRKGGTVRPPPPHGLRQPRVDAPYHARARLGMQECRCAQPSPLHMGCATLALPVYAPRLGGGGVRAKRGARIQPECEQQTRARCATPALSVYVPHPGGVACKGKWHTRRGSGAHEGEVAHAKGKWRMRRGSGAREGGAWSERRPPCMRARGVRAKRGAREGGNTERGCAQPEREWRTRVSLRAAPGRRRASRRAACTHAKGVRDGTTRVQAANPRSAHKDVRVRRGTTRVGELRVNRRAGTSKQGCGAKRSPGEAVWEWRARP